MNSIHWAQADCDDGVILTPDNCKVGLPVRATADLGFDVKAGTVGHVYEYIAPHPANLNICSLFCFFDFWNGMESGQLFNNLDNLVIHRH